jgi:hypothetical protein
MLAWVVLCGSDSSTFQQWDGTPRGGILTTTEGNRTTVRLEGDIDLAMAGQPTPRRIPTTRR